MSPVAVHIGNKAHFVFVICISLFFAAVTANVFTDEKKTFIWHFDEGCGDMAREATASCNDGKFYGSGIQWTEGKLNKGLVFTGSDAHPQWINVPHSPDLNIQQAITMEAWMFPNEIGPTRATIIHKSSSYHLQLDMTSKVTVRLYGLEPSGYQTSHGRVKICEWNHIAITYDGTEIKFYINGEQDENVASATGKIKRTTNPVFFGGDWPG